VNGLSHLDAQLAAWGQYQRLDLVSVRVNLLQHRQGEGSRLAGAGLRLPDAHPALPGAAGWFHLDRRGGLIAHVIDCAVQRLAQSKLVERIWLVVHLIRPSSVRGFSRINGDISWKDSYLQKGLSHILDRQQPY